MPYIECWFDNREWDNKLIYRIGETKKGEIKIPAIVQKILEQMNFVEWDAEEHSEEQWNILWKS